MSSVSGTNHSTNAANESREGEEGSPGLSIDSTNLRQDDFFFSKACVDAPTWLRDEYHAIGDIADAASSGMDFPQFSYYVAKIITYATGAYGATLFLYSHEEMLVREVGRYSCIRLPNILDQYTFPLSTGRLQRVMDDGKLIVFGPGAFHESDVPIEPFGIDLEYGISVPISDGYDILGSYTILFQDKVYQDIEFLLTLSKVLASHIKLMERAQREAMNPGKSQLAVQILNSIESVLGPLAARSGVQSQTSVISECLSREKLTPATLLSRDDVELLVLIAEGCSNEVISQKLCLSASAVKKRVSALMRKLGMDNRVQLCAYAFRSGFVA